MITRVSIPVLSINVTATSSTRTLNKFWQEIEMTKHHRRLSQARSQVEVGPPAIYPHMKINAKQQYVTDGNNNRFYFYTERYKEIARDNKVLLVKILHMDDQLKENEVTKNRSPKRRRNILQMDDQIIEVSKRSPKRNSSKN